MFGIPQNLSIGSFARGASQAVGFLDKWPIAKKTIGFLGTPVFHDLNKEYGPDRDEKAKSEGGVLYYLKRYFSWGIVVSALGYLGSLIYNRFASGKGEGEQQQPTLLKTLSNLGLTICKYGGVLGAVYSEWNKLNVLFKCGEDAQAIALGAGFLENIKVREKEELIGKTKNSPLRFNDGKDQLIPDEAKVINGLCEAPDNDLKAIFIGPTGTGKTEAMDLIVGCHVKRNPDKYIVWNVNGNEVAAKIKTQLDKQGDIGGILEMAKGHLKEADDFKEVYKAFTQMSVAKMLGSVLSAIKVEAKRAHKANKRLIVQFDEIDKLLNLAKGDDNAMAAIAAGLSELLDYKDLDILFASNATLKDMLGLGEKYKTITDLEQSPLANLWGRMRNRVCTLSNPGFHTQARIIATYLLSLPARLNVAEEKLFATDITDAIKSKDDYSQKEAALAQVIYDSIYKSMENNKEEEEIYGYLSGRDLMTAITKKLRDNNLLSSGKLKGGVTIDLEMVRKETRTATEPFREALKDIKNNGKVGQPILQPARKEITLEEFVDSLLRLPDNQFVEQCNSNPQVQQLIAHVLHQDDSSLSPKVRQFRERVQSFLKDN